MAYLKYAHRQRQKSLMLVRIIQQIMVVITKENDPQGLSQWLKHSPVTQAASVRTPIQPKILSAPTVLGNPHRLHSLSLLIARSNPGNRWSDKREEQG